MWHEMIIVCRSTLWLSKSHKSAYVFRSVKRFAGRHGKSRWPDGEPKDALAVDDSIFYISSHALYNQRADDAGRGASGAITYKVSGRGPIFELRLRVRKRPVAC